ncbi:LysR family transcriptional regulator [Geodermatophilus ruber]|uniref:DNA-binding transcriptional regulator, LysR family n=1 Tax=Geodermatophilus ruber TaxID=504800 RepID=A0A1I4G4C7_9ACTN|nr:LysR family transcriptional regulator [Geodermatophilus ruber]SFL24330.1 DNA-binding transcriptional regulator, LysR family [Geodermatophilus ruber]
MELRQLEHFLAVVEGGSFTSAAGRVFLAQSSLSASLLALERELGTELFIRGRRGAELTDAGRAFLEPARAVLEHADRARNAVAEITGLLRGSVRVAAVAAPRSLDIVATIRRFHAEHPGVDVRVVPAGARSMTDLVIDGQVDFALAPRTERMTPALQFEPLISTPLAVFCPAGHRLAGAHDVDPHDLVDESIIDLTPGWQSRELFDRLLEEHGVRRQVRLEVDGWWGLLSMVQQGMGIAYGPRDCVDHEIFDGVAVATLTGAPLWELGIVTRDETLRGAAGRAFLAAYREQIASLGARG